MPSQIAERISCVPRDYNAGEISTATLVKRSGLLEDSSGLRLEELEEIFREHPKRAEEWLERWNNQRITGGWVMEHEGNYYRLKNFTTGHNLLIADKMRACAEFAARYMQRIGDVIKKYDG